MKRRVILWLLIIAFIWVVVSRFADIRKLFNILLTGHPLWVLAALASQVTYYVCLSALFVANFRAVGVKARIRDVAPVLFASLFVNVIAPGAGAALFVDDAARRGESPTKAAIGTLMELITDLAAFSVALIAGIAYLAIRGELIALQVIGAVILLTATSAVTVVLLLGLWRPPTLKRILVFVQGKANSLIGFGGRLLRRSPERLPHLSDAWVERTAEEFLGAADAMRDNPRRLIPVILIAFLCHIVDLVTVFLLFHAFHTRVTFGTLLAGYAVGILFWFVSITPQGIGLVEGMMALTYTSLGVPAEVATIVALSFRGLTFWLPVLLGFFLLQRIRTFSAGQRARADVWNVRIISILTALMGIANLVSGVMPVAASRLHILQSFIPLYVRHGSHLTSVLAGFALLILAGSLWRRKRIAWLLTLIVLVISVFSHLLKGLDVELAAVSAILAIWLFFLRSHFHARSDTPSIWQGLRVLAVAFFFTLIYGTLGFYLLDRQFHQRINLGQALRETVILFTQFYDPGLIPTPYTRFSEYFENSIYLVGAITFGYALFMLIRPVLVRAPASSEQHRKAEDIVKNYGHSSVARFTLFPDKSYFFSQGGTLFSYVTKRGIALVLGDPIGPQEDFSPAVLAFQRFCAQNDWQAAFYQALPDHVFEYRDLGYQTICIGQEAIVDLESFSLEGKSNKPVRNAVTHITRLGYRVEFFQPPLSLDMLAILRDISDEWLTHMHGTEKRYSTGWFFDDYIRSTPVVIVYDEEGMAQAFANIIVEYKRNEISVDLMRHRPDIENGTMDYLFASLLEWAKGQGYTTFDLGLSALSGLSENSDDPSIERALHYIFEHVNQFYNFKGLFKFKEKFHPVWSPRYLVFPSMASIPLVALALMQADSGDSFLTDMLKDFLLSTRRKKLA